jgi:hypothetical protein
MEDPMKRVLLRLLIAAGMIMLGWAAGRAQSSQPDFELIVNSPPGETTVECNRGCQLAWVERGVSPTVTPNPTFKYGCSGTERCSSYKIGGWIKR